MQKRLFLHSVAALLATAAFSPALLAQGKADTAKPKIPVEVWKDPNCGCCKDWVVYLEANGFAVKVYDTGNAAVRAKLKIAEQFGSCHTALIGGYAIEGHVPVREINRLLKERTKAIGISVPGMPIGTPGMDAPTYQGREDAYSVLLLAHGGASSVYQTYPGKPRNSNKAA